MTYKAIFLDLDGTLITSDKKITDRNIQAINSAVEMGVRVVLSSGRASESLRPFRKALGLLGSDDYASMLNGGLVELGVNCVRQQKMKAVTGIKLVQELKKLRFKHDFIRVFTKLGESAIESKSAYHSAYNSHVNAKPLIVDSLEEEISRHDEIFEVLIFAEPEEVLEAKRHMETVLPPDVNMFLSGTHMLEMCSIKANKGESLKYIAGKLGLRPEETIAMGDNHNDLAMLKTAGLAACPANADLEVLTAAAYVCENTNETSAVAEVIGKYIL